MADLLSGTGPHASGNQPLICKEWTENLAIGRLGVREWLLSGLRFRHLHGEFHETGVLEHVVQADRVVMVFVLKGRVRFVLPNMEIEWGVQHYNTFFTGDESVKLQAEELELELFLVEWDTALFLEVVEEAAEPWPNFAVAVQDRRNAILFAESIYYDLAIQAILQQLRQCTVGIPHQRLFFRSKAMELMALQADCWKKLFLPIPVHSKRDYDRERLFFAKEFLLEHMATPPTLSELARIAGINEYKLKGGFKELFGNTVFGYLAEVRLELAKAELIEGNKTATEIAFDLGYSSLQHFSAAFKKRFGVSPNEVRG